MSSFITLAIFILVIVGLLAFSTRARRRQAAVQAQRAEHIDVGTEVMTTSGLYGTVTARHDDESVQLQIAPGVEVRWALAALREVAMLPPEFGGGPVVDDTDDWSGVGVKMDKSPDIVVRDDRGEQPGNPGVAPAT